MKKTRIFSNKVFIYSLMLLSGLILGRLLFHPGQKAAEVHDHMEEISEETIWTCAMHPHIKMPQPGKCPICGMDLIPLGQSSSKSVDPEAIQLKPDALQMANVLTSVVSKKRSIKEVRLYGKVDFDERRLQNQVSHVNGRIESLLVNFKGEQVFTGQVLGRIYSPELVTAQQELLEAAKIKNSQPVIYQAAREKLRQWKFTDDQIEDIETSAAVQPEVNIISNTSGVVTARRINTGDYVSAGTVLYDIADLSKVWVLFEAYETDLQYLRTGQEISFTIQAISGNRFSGRVIFIDPVIDPVTRVARVRVEADNSSGKLKPGMFATGLLISSIYDNNDNIVIPRSSVLWTGKRSIVYVKLNGTDDPSFKIREVELGPAVGEGYIVSAGLAEGEEIVTSGTFSIDAAAQLEGKPSMMNSTGGNASGIHGHDNAQ